MQQALHNPYIEFINNYQQKNDDKLPIITAEDMLEFKELGFYAIFDRLLVCFKDRFPPVTMFDNLLRDIIRGAFQALLNSVAEHTAFYEIQADVANKINEKFPAKPSDMDLKTYQKEKHAYSIELFDAAGRNALEVSGDYKLALDLSRNQTLNNEYKEVQLSKLAVSLQPK